MYPEDEELAGRCLDLAEVAREAGSWVADNRALVLSEADLLAKDLGQAARLFQKYAVAARRKMCVGIFGPSQAGKSYLVSSLGKDEAGSLLTDFAGQKVNFLKEINPRGGKESTGLVTRFTTSRREGLPSGYPVHLRLLGEGDLVKILANSYYEDFIHKDALSPEIIKETLDALSARKSPNLVGRLTRDDLLEVQAYLAANFPDREAVRTLERVFWPTAVELAPWLESKDRARLLGLVWYGAEAFSELYRQLYRILEQLDFAAEVAAPLAALLPREDPQTEKPLSIIDVATWQDQLGEDGPRLNLSTTDGRRQVEVSRSLATALIAEVSMFMASRTAPFLQHTDLLDFPGYRSRLKYKDLAATLADEAVVRRLFVRGKVAYLFQRYCAEGELTGMLLCVDEGPQEVQTLPGVIEEWVKESHGPTPDKRTGVEKSLFLVLTKMDLHFSEAEGSTGDVSQRWSTRLQTSLLDYFGKGPEWPLRWDKRGPFNNLFWLRNTSFHVPGYFNYDSALAGQGVFRETGVRGDMADYLARLREGFLANEDVRRHFADPARAWDAALTIGDGGVGYLREKLEPICRPEIKRRQIRARLAEELAHLTAKLTPYYKSGDKEAELRKKAELGRRLSGFLAACAQAQRFGELLTGLMVTDSELYDLYFQTESYGDAAAEATAESPAAPPEPPPLVGETVLADDLLRKLFQGSPAGSPATPAPGVPAQPAYRDETARFCKVIGQFWVARLFALAGDQALQSYFSPSQPWEANALVHELIQAAERLGVWAQMEEDLRQAAGYRNLSRDKLIWKQASRAAHALNDFVAWLGLDPRAASREARTVPVGDNRLVVFEPPPELIGLPELSETQSPFEEPYILGWMAAFFHLMMKNVDFDSDTAVDLGQNQRLGDLLARMTV
ncbi:MAG: putative virulence factor [Deltaproteobacteria bacterium]|nr:putative virulence factor [Deltaproteobacteria bacterium]